MGADVKCRCGARVRVPEAGQYVPCPKCGTMVTLPLSPPPAPRDVPRSKRPPVSVPPAPPPVPTAEAPDEFPCPRCGAPLGRGMRQCLGCGHRLDARSAAGGASRGGRLAGKLVLLVAAVALVGGAVNGLSRRKPSKPEPPPREPGGYTGVLIKSHRRAKELAASVEVQHTIQAFHALEGRFPKDLEEPAEKGMPIPPPPKGYRYEYNPQTGEVKVIRIEPTREPPPQ